MSGTDSLDLKPRALEPRILKPSSPVNPKIPILSPTPCMQTGPKQGVVNNIYIYIYMHLYVLHYMLSVTPISR